MIVNDYGITCRRTCQSCRHAGQRNQFDQYTCHLDHIEHHKNHTCDNWSAHKSVLMAGKGDGESKDPAYLRWLATNYNTLTKEFEPILAENPEAAWLPFVHNRYRQTFHKDEYGRRIN